MTTLFLLARRTAMPWLAEVHSDAETAAFIGHHVIPDLETWVAMVGEDAAGFIAIKPGWVEHLYIHPNYQRQGIGNLLLDKAKARMSGGFELWLFQRNTPARWFYERHGLHCVEETDGSANEEREPDARYVWP